MILPYAIIFSIICLIFLGRGKIVGTNFSEDTRFDKQALSLLFLFFYVLFAFKSYRVGADSWSYFSLYEQISQLGFTQLSRFYVRFERGFVYYNKLLSLLFPHPQFLFIISGVIILGVYYNLIKKYSKMLLLSTFLFFTLRIFDFSMSGIRQALAIAILVFSYSFVRKNKTIPFVFLVIVATLFHRSAIVFLLAWFVNKVEISKKILVVWIFGIIFSIISASIVVSFLLSRGILHAFYADSRYFEGGVLAAPLLLIISLLIVVFSLVSKSYMEPNRENGVDIFDNKNMLILQMIACVMLGFNLYFSILNRVALNFNTFSIILVSNSLRSMRNTKYYALLYTAVIVLFALYFIVILIFRPTWTIYPFSFNQMFFIQMLGIR